MYIEGTISVENVDNVDKVLLYDIDKLEIIDETDLVNCKYRFVLTQDGKFVVLLRMKSNDYKTSYYSEVLYGKGCSTK